MDVVIGIVIPWTAVFGIAFWVAVILLAAFLIKVIGAKDKDGCAIAAAWVAVVGLVVLVYNCGGFD